MNCVEVDSVAFSNPIALDGARIAGISNNITHLVVANGVVLGVAELELRLKSKGVLSLELIHAMGVLLHKLIVVNTCGGATIDVALVSDSSSDDSVLSGCTRQEGTES